MSGHTNFVRLKGHLYTPAKWQWAKKIVIVAGNVIGATKLETRWRWLLSSSSSNISICWNESTILFQQKSHKRFVFITTTIHIAAHCNIKREREIETNENSVSGCGRQTMTGKHEWRHWFHFVEQHCSNTAHTYTHIRLWNGTAHGWYTHKHPPPPPNHPTPVFRSKINL